MQNENKGANLEVKVSVTENCKWLKRVTKQGTHFPAMHTSVALMSKIINFQEVKTLDLSDWLVGYIFWREQSTEDSVDFNYPVIIILIKEQSVFLSVLFTQ